MLLQNLKRRAQERMEVLQRELVATARAHVVELDTVREHHAAELASERARTSYWRSRADTAETLLETERGVCVGLRVDLARAMEAVATTETTLHETEAAAADAAAESDRLLEQMARRAAAMEEAATEKAAEAAQAATQEAQNTSKLG